jgi:hypothetical protein
VGFLSISREPVAFIFLVAGALLAAFALAWWFIAAFRATRKGGPVTLAAVGAMLAVAPYSVHALNGRVLDLGRPAQLLEGQFQFQLTEPGGTDVARAYRIQALVAAAGAALFGLAVVWLMLRGLRKETRPKVRWPVALLGVAVLIIAIPLAVSSFARSYVDLGPRERVVDGQVHITLTGWDQTDYSVLRTKPETAVLQMANPDVTDETLDLLRGMARLRELDLSNSAVTDAGLAALAGLPLERLRLARTNVTDAGFKDHLASMDTLTMLDLSGTGVKPETIDTWKKARPGRRALH